MVLIRRFPSQPTSPVHGQRILLALSWMVLAFVISSIDVDAFAIQRKLPSVWPANRGFLPTSELSDGSSASWPSMRPSELRESNGGNDEPILSSVSTNAIMSETSYLSHAMLKVPSVNDAVAFWEEKGGEVFYSRSNGKTNGEEELLIAQVTIGAVGSGSRTKNNGDNATKDQRYPSSFFLELSKSSVGKAARGSGNHGLSYLGLSMLLNFQDKNMLLELIKEITTGDSSNEEGVTKRTTTSSDCDEQFPTKSVASAPGDGFAQIALLSDNRLAETCDFYTTVLGMDQKAQDQKILCLRYDCKREDDKSPSKGVATTLVFENRPRSGDDDGDASDSNFDHLAIRTTSSIEGLYADILAENESIVYMKPTFMHGVNLIGLIDPNGYKVVVFGDNK